MPAILGYYKVRGLAQYIRYLLEYTGEDYVEKIYNFGPPPEYDKSPWFEEKFKLGLDFPNVPYYIDGDFKLTQSNAIFRYIASKHNLLGETNEDKAKADMLACEAFDLRIAYVALCYNSDFEKSAKQEFINEKMRPKLVQFSKFLGNNNWFIGNKITYADFIIYEILCCFKLLSEEILNEFKNLNLFMKRFEDLEPIKKYMNSDRHIKFSFHGPTAYFSGE